MTSTKRKRTGRPAVSKADAIKEGATRRAKGRFRFFSDIIAELKKVTWLSKREVAHLTVIVLIVVAIVGVILGVIDYGFSTLINLFAG
jgi:preprotein translocase subunit SecE